MPIEGDISFYYECLNGLTVSYNAKTLCKLDLQVVACMLNCFRFCPIPIQTLKDFGAKKSSLAQG